MIKEAAPHEGGSHHKIFISVLGARAGAPDRRRVRDALAVRGWARSAGFGGV